MDGFKHFLITRFNIPLVTTPQKKWAEGIEAQSKLDCLNEKWLELRMELFKIYTLPSVRNQSTQDFTWIILIHKDTPRDIRRFLRDNLKHIGINSQFVKGTGPDYQMASYAVWREMKNYEEKDFQWVITTGLDCDDALSREYLAEVQRQFREQREYVNIVKGYRVAHHDGLRYIGDVSGRKVNHFRSFIERRDNIFTVYGMYHGRSEQMAPVNHVDCYARWLEVIHGKNCSNRFKQGKNDKTRPIEELAEKFGIDPEKVKNTLPLDASGYITNA